MANANFNSPLASRSSHDLGYQFIGSSDFGRITPFFCKELIPTDHFSIRTSAFVRMLPLVVPTFGQADLQVHFAFVLSRMLKWSVGISSLQKKGVIRPKSDEPIN